MKIKQNHLIIVIIAIVAIAVILFTQLGNTPNSSENIGTTAITDIANE